MKGIPECLKDISPQWYKLLNKVNDLSEARGKGRLDISKYQQCIVGEAYKFNDSFVYPEKLEFTYGCKTCLTLANIFDELIVFNGNNKLKRDTKFNETVERFCKHMKSNHGKIVIKV